MIVSIIANSYSRIEPRTNSAASLVNTGFQGLPLNSQFKINLLESS